MSIHGHSWNVNFGFNFFKNNSIDTCINKNEGLICEYTELKGHFSDFIKDILDHSILLNVDDPIIETLSENKSDRILCFNNDPTTEVIALHLLCKLHAISVKISKKFPLFPLKSLSIHLKETTVNSVEVETGFISTLLWTKEFPAWATNYENIRNYISPPEWTKS